jgi:eukaryotic-like serine/threonine-protein kinase
MSATIPLTPGSLFADVFRVVRPLGRGGMGTVYEVQQESTGALRALKLMLPQLADDAKFIRRFEQEARVSSQIESDHVVQVLDAGVELASQTPWIAMELLRGEQLSSYVRRKDGLSKPEMAEVFKQLCHALDAAHRVGIVHCDLKPENIFLARSRREGVPFTVKVLDFGIAKIVASARATTTMMLGSPMWVAPEQTEADGRVDGRTDIWALGLLAFFCLTGKSYWLRANVDARSLPALMRELLFDPLAPASDRARVLGRGGVLPDGFDDWFARCVTRESDERYPDVAEAREALLTLFEASGAWLPEGGRPTVEPPIPRSLPPPPVELSLPESSPLPPPPVPAAPLDPSIDLAAFRPRWKAPLAAVAGVLAIGGAVLVGMFAQRSGAGVEATASVAADVSEHLPVAVAASAAEPASSAPAAEAAAPAPAREPLAAAPAAKPAAPSPEAVSISGLPEAPPLGGSPRRPAPAIDRQASTEPAGKGYLVMICVPYCDSVVVRGRNLGPSPIVKHALAPGSYSASLLKKGLPMRRVTFSVKPGETTAVRIRLTEPRAPQCDPPYTVDSRGVKRVKPECRPL